MEHTTNEHTNAPTPNDGTNPHAEIPPSPPADWKAEPLAWISEHIGASERARYGAEREQETARASEALSALLAPYESSPQAVSIDAEPLRVLLSACFARLDWSTREDPRFLRFGGLLFPTSAGGLSVLRALRTVARESVLGAALVPNVEQESPLGVLFARLREDRLSALLQSERNRTDSEHGGGFRIGFDFHARAMGAIPAGSKLPTPLLAPELEGFEVSDPIEFQRECDMCDDGTADFLEQHGIEFEREGGSYECDSCGSEHESDEQGSIEYIAPFVLSASMVADIERQGFGDAARDYIAEGADADSLSALLEQDPDERAKPDAEHGIRFDSDVWAFEPDFGSVEGADEIEGSEALEIGALLSAIVNEHTSAGVLPPIGGTLRYRPLPYESNRIGTSTRNGIALVWDPSAGSLVCSLSEALRVRFDVRKQARTLETLATNGSPHAPRFVLEPHGGEFVAQAGHTDGGERARSLLAIAKARAEI